MAKKFYLDNYYPASDGGQAIPSSCVSFEVLANACLAQAERLVAQWLPEGRREGQEWVALNPTRADSHLGSFKVNLVTGHWADFATGDKGGDLISLYGYLYGLKNGQAASHLLETMGMVTTQPATTAGGSPRKPTWTPITPVPTEASPAPAHHYRYGPPSAVWTYRDQAERVLFHIYRFDLSKGKQLLPLTYCQNPSGQRAWRWQGLEAPRPLYNLHLLIARPNEQVVINEGEKAVDAATLLLPDYVATTSSHGCQSPHKTDWMVLASRHLLIWPDADDAGRAYAEAVATLALKAGAASVHILNIAVFGPVPPGWDAADALAEGWMAEQVTAIVRNPANWITPRFNGHRYARIAGSTANLTSAEEAISATEDRRGLPVITLGPGKLSPILMEAETALIDAQAPIYQRGGQLVRPLILPAEVKNDYSKIPAGTLVIEPITKQWLTIALNEVALWQRYDARRKKLVAVDCPPYYAELLLSKKGAWRARVLTGIIECPILRRDGSLLSQLGYDPQTGLYLNYSGPPVEVPANPTRGDALKALNILKEPFEEFPFVDEVDCSVALSGVLTAIERRTFKTAPYHVGDAPVHGSGKGLLVNTIARISTGRDATSINLGLDPAEDEKRLGALLIKGCSVINIDNIERGLNGDFLCSLATQSSVDHRILGTSSTVTIPTNVATIFVTGNNATPVGDMTRRVLICRIDPQCERPDVLKFQRNLDEFVPVNRHRLLSAALTMLRAYICAGQPAHGKGPYGSFEQWDALIRGALLWLDQPDPLDSRERIAANDPETTKLRCLLTAWFEVFKEDRVSTAQIIKAATPRSGDDSFDHPGGTELRQALLEIAGKGDTINARSLGWYLSKKRDRVVGDYRLEVAGEYDNKPVWKVRLIHRVSRVSRVLYSQYEETVNLQQEKKDDNLYMGDEKNTKNANNARPAATKHPPLLDNNGYTDNLMEANASASSKFHHGPSAYGSQTQTNQPSPVISHCQACRHYSALAYSCGDSGHYVGNTDHPLCEGRRFQPLLDAIGDEKRV